MPENWLEEMILFEGLTLQEAHAISDRCWKRVLMAFSQKAWTEAVENRRRHMYEKWMGCKVPTPVRLAMSSLSVVLLEQGEPAALSCLQGLWPRQSLTGS